MRRTTANARQEIAKGTEKHRQAPRGQMVKGRRNTAVDEYGDRCHDIFPRGGAPARPGPGAKTARYAAPHAGLYARRKLVITTTAPRQRAVLRAKRRKRSGPSTRRYKLRTGRLSEIDDGAACDVNELVTREIERMDDIRGVFLQKLETILPETRNMTNADCLALLMGDEPPQEIENLLYRFLSSLFRRRLGILAAQGEGL